MEGFQSLTKIQNAIHQGTLKMPQVLEHYLKQIKNHQHLNAFIEVFTDEARAIAIEVQEKLEKGTAGKLAGMVIGIKDNICYRDHKVSACSKILGDYVSPYSATVVERLIAEDAIIIGRLNCDEFAMGASNETSIYGSVKNYADPTKVSGGSSGGSAVAVQAGLCLATLGTDTGGSVRQPAAFCGIIGLKPSYGRVSRHGIISYASSFDQVGTLTKSIGDAALLLEVIAGTDDYDSTISSRPVPAYSKNLALKERQRKVAYFPEILNAPGLDIEIGNVFKSSIEQLQAKGNIVEAVSFKYLDYIVPTYYILTMAEASSNLGRYDGVHYGYRSKNAYNLETTYKKSRSEGFGTEVKRRIMLGTFVLSADYYACYPKAQKVRRLIRDKTDEILKEYDFILMPTTPTTAFAIGEESKDPVVKYLADIFTVQASLAGLPAISLPVGNNKNGLPIGLQLLGRRFGEAELLAFAKYFKEKVV